MIQFSVDKIKDVPETMLIPLWARAAETGELKPIIRDAKAAEMVARIDYDFSKFTGSWLTQTGVAVRTMIFDREVKKFIADRKKSVVINLGCGLDTRFQRLNDKRIAVWYDLDVPEAIELRKKFFSENDKNRFIAKSVFEYSWMDEIDDDNADVLIIAEGIFMYFTESQLKVLFARMINRFPAADILFETIPPLLIGRGKMHETVKKTNSRPDFYWGIKKGKGMERWDKRITFNEEWNFFDYHRSRWRFLRMLSLIKPFKNNFNNRIISLSFGK